MSASEVTLIQIGLTLIALVGLLIGFSRHLGKIVRGLDESTRKSAQSPWRAGS